VRGRKAGRLEAQARQQGARPPPGAARPGRQKRFCLDSTFGERYCDIIIYQVPSASRQWCAVSTTGHPASAEGSRAGPIDTERRRGAPSSTGARASRARSAERRVTPARARVAYVGRAGRTATARARSYLPSPPPPLRNATVWQPLAVVPTAPIPGESDDEGSRWAEVLGRFLGPGSFYLPHRVGVEGPWPQVVRCLQACSAYPTCCPRQNVKNGHKIAERPVGGTNPARASSRSPGPFLAVSRVSIPMATPRIPVTLWGTSICWTSPWTNYHTPVWGQPSPASSVGAAGNETIWVASFF
jgi:hypothetical protein